MRIVFSRGEVFNFTKSRHKWQMLASFQQEHRVPNGRVLRCWRQGLRQDVDSIVLGAAQFIKQDTFSFTEGSERKRTWHRGQRYYMHLAVSL